MDPKNCYRKQMVKWRIWLSWLGAAIFVANGTLLRGKVEGWTTWIAFGLFLLAPWGIERFETPPILERILRYFWIGIVLILALQWIGSFEFLTRHGTEWATLSVAAYMGVWVYRDVIFLRSGSVDENKAAREMTIPPVAGFPTVLRKIADEFSVPALGVAVTNGAGRLDWMAVTGRRRVDAPDLVTVADRFHLGSCGKSMTATLAGVLVDQGRLEWKLTLGEFFSGIKIHPGYAPVTLEQLLCHRGGVPGDLKPDGLWARLWQQQGSPTEQRAYLVGQVLGKPPPCRPGSRYLYSNAGFAIAGAMIEQLLKEPWESCIQARLFQPLGMTSVGFGAPLRPGKNDQPWGHRFTPGSSPQPVEPELKADNPAAIAPAGTMHCTLADWARYAAFHLSGESREGTLRLSSATLHKLHTPDGDRNYAYGWMVTRRSWTRGRALTHAGSNTMFYAVIWLVPRRDFAVMAVTNMGGDHAFQACDRAISKVIEG